MNPPTFSVTCDRCQMFRFSATREDAATWMETHAVAHAEVDMQKNEWLAKLPKVMPARILRPRKRKGAPTV